jgi:hypothetical protein
MLKEKERALSEVPLLFSYGEIELYIISPLPIA